MESIETKRKSQSENGVRHKPDLSYLESTLGYVMKRSLVELYRSIYESLENSDLTLVQFSVLSIAQDNPGISQSEMALALGFERPRLVPIINTLEDMGLAERRQNPNDRRGRMIYLTPAGQTCIKTLKRKFDTHQALLKSEMGEPRFEALMESLAWITQNRSR